MKVRKSLPDPCHEKVLALVIIRLVNPIQKVLMGPLPFW
ncbi:hypothetical protein SAM19_04222 [Brevibacillus laterosporus]|nr:hypothetical protein [Brevibacillus laterosporus]